LFFSPTKNYAYYQWSVKKKTNHTCNNSEVKLAENIKQFFKKNQMKTNIYIKLLLLLTLIVTAFHLGIIAKLIPYDVAWGGRLKTYSEMYTFEIISVFVNLFLISVLLIKGCYLKFQVNKNAVNIVLWFFFSFSALIQLEIF